MHEKYDDKGLVLVSVSLDRVKTDEIKTFVEEKELTFLNLHDQTMQVGALYGVRGIPATYIIDKTGKVVGSVVGPRPWDGEEVEKLVEELLAEETG